jgi:glycosyltransferase involved in cell wall biosynthesis
MDTRKQILIDLLRLKDLNTGLGQVCRAYGKELAAACPPHFRFTFLVPPAFAGYFGDGVDYIVPKTIPDLLFPRLLSKRFDLWHGVHQDIYYYPSKRVPFVLTIHDLNFIREKTAMKIKWRKRHLHFLLQRAAQTVAISHYTRQDVERHLQPSSPVEVIYNGVDISTDVKSRRPAFVGPDRFFFALGVFKPNKNYQSLVRLMKEYPAGRQLIIAGSHQTACGREILQLIHREGLQDRIITPGPVSEDDKTWLYAHCEALLFPSTNEGMGLPVIEAMRFGKPVVAARASCLPEFGGRYASYFPSFEPEAMRRCIEECLADCRQHPERSEERKGYAGQFVWQRNAQQYIQLFEQLLGIPSNQRL